jgi:putative ABC transport system permease protein
MLLSLVTLFTGAYPAILLSSFKPLEALKGRGVGNVGRESLRKGLVVFQFCISIGLIIGTLVVEDQLQFIQSKNLGFDKEQVLVVRQASALGSRQEDFLRKLRIEPAVLDAAAVQFLPGQLFDSMGFSVQQPANYEFTSLSYNWVDGRFVDVLKLKLVSGRNFNPQIASDSSSFLINEAAAKAIGWKEPLGKELSLGSFYQGPVIGVVADFNFESLHHEVKPMVFLFNRRPALHMALRLAPGLIQQGIRRTEELWSETVQGLPLEYTFLDENLQNQYQSEERLSGVFSVFSSLAVFIGCLGLFGLASFTADQRTKEIGIRKVLGATETGIVGMLVREFAVLVVIAFVLAAPISWFAMSEWLTNFAYRTDLSIWIFLAAGVGAFLIALLTVSIQAIKAAIANPVESLRYE